MGIWGYRLFEDDGALDIRGDFRDLIGDGLSAEAATSKMVKTWVPERDDPQQYATFWLALAAVQWDLGRLTPLALRRALTVIDQEIGLEQWADEAPKLLQKRRGVYRELRKLLLRPPPPPKRVPRRRRHVAEWLPGTLLSYRCRSERLIYLRVLRLHTDKGGEVPIVDICDWDRQTPLSPKQAARKRRRYPLPRHDHGWFRDSPAHGTFAVYAARKSDFPAERLAVIANGLKFKNAEGPGTTFFGGWSRLDAYLEEEYGIA